MASTKRRVRHANRRPGDSPRGDGGPAAIPVGPPRLEDSVAGVNGSTSFGPFLPREQVAVLVRTLAGPIGVLHQALWSLDDFGNPTGPSTAALYTVSGVIGVNAVPGALLATSDVLETADINSPRALRVYDFSGAERIALAPLTAYFLACDASGITAPINNHLTVGRTDPEPGADDGTATHNGAAWAFFTADRVFNFEFWSSEAPI